MKLLLRVQCTIIQLSERQQVQGSPGKCMIVSFIRQVIYFILVLFMCVRSREGIRSLGAGVTPDAGVRNQVQVLCNDSKTS